MKEKIKKIVSILLLLYLLLHLFFSLYNILITEYLCIERRQFYTFGQSISYSAVKDENDIYYYKLNSVIPESEYNYLLKRYRYKSGEAKEIIKNNLPTFIENLKNENICDILDDKYYKVKINSYTFSEDKMTLTIFYEINNKNKSKDFKMNKSCGIVDRNIDSLTAPSSLCDSPSARVNRNFKEYCYIFIFVLIVSIIKNFKNKNVVLKTVLLFIASKIIYLLFIDNLQLKLIIFLCFGILQALLLFKNKNTTLSAFCILIALSTFIDISYLNYLLQFC